MRVIKNASDAEGVQVGEDIIFDVDWPDPPQTEQDIRTFDVRYEQARRKREQLEQAVARALKPECPADETDNGNNGNNGNNGRLNARNA